MGSLSWNRDRAAVKHVLPPTLQHTFNWCHEWREGDENTPGRTWQKEPVPSVMENMREPRVCSLQRQTVFWDRNRKTKPERSFGLGLKHPRGKWGKDHKVSECWAPCCDPPQRRGEARWCWFAKHRQAHGGWTHCWSAWCQAKRSLIYGVVCYLFSGMHCLQTKKAEETLRKDINLLKKFRKKHPSASNLSFSKRNNSLQCSPRGLLAATIVPRPCNSYLKCFHENICCYQGPKGSWKLHKIDIEEILSEALQISGFVA